MESKTTVFINGHHKPVHKVNDIHHRVGAPYRVPARSHTINGSREYAQRSSDSLPLSKDLMGPLPNPPFHGSVTSAPHPVRRVKSEHGSPTISALPAPPGNPIPPISIPPYDSNAYSYSPFSSGSPVINSAGGSPWDGTFPEQFPDNYFVSYDTINGTELPASPAGLGPDPAEIDWSTYNLPNGLRYGTPGYRLANGSAVPSQPPSYASFDLFSHLSHPGLTPSSGDVSEGEDFVPVGEPTSLRNSSQDVLNDFSSVGGDEPTDLETFRLSAASSYVGMPQASMLAADDLDTLDIDEYLKHAEAKSLEVALQNQRMQLRHQQQSQQGQMSPNTSHIFHLSPDPPQHALSVEEAAKYSHQSTPRSVSRPGNSAMPTVTLPSDPMVSSSLTALNNIRDADDRDDGWVR